MRMSFVRFFHQNRPLYLTSTELATALRPFYFAVHPDLFGQHPHERCTNENSLKQLSLYLETLQNRRLLQPCNVTFYIRDNTYLKNKSNAFRLVKIHLRENELRDVVLKVLKACDLNTDFIENIPKASPQKFNERLDRTNDMDFTNINSDDMIFDSFSMKNKIRKVQENIRLGKWMESNYKDARAKCEATKPMREDIDVLSAQLSSELKLKDLQWECGWNIQHFKGCLLSLNALLLDHPENLAILKERVLVFAPFTGVSLDGHIMLNSGEVRHNWLDLIKNIKKYDEHLERIPAFEKAVSQVLRDIKVMRRKFMPKILAGEYERHLQQITTSLSDFLTHKKFPESWPTTLKNFEIVIETEAGPLMVSPTGQFIVPASCPGFLLVSFITENLNNAQSHMEKYLKDKHIERSLKKECKQQLQLLDIRKDDNVTPEMMITSCENLLHFHSQLSPHMNGIHLNICTYYSVLSDGIVCIPWNWKL